MLAGSPFCDFENRPHPSLPLGGSIGKDRPKAKTNIQSHFFHTAQTSFVICTAETYLSISLFLSVVCLLSTFCHCYFSYLNLFFLLASQVFFSLSLSRRQEPWSPLYCWCWPQCFVGIIKWNCQLMPVKGLYLSLDSLLYLYSCSTVCLGLPLSFLYMTYCSIKHWFCGHFSWGIHNMIFSIEIKKTLTTYWCFVLQKLCQNPCHFTPHQLIYTVTEKLHHWWSQVCLSIRVLWVGKKCTINLLSSTRKSKKIPVLWKLFQWE